MNALLAELFVPMPAMQVSIPLYEEESALLLASQILQSLATSSTSFRSICSWNGMNEPGFWFVHLIAQYDIPVHHCYLQKLKSCLTIFPLIRNVLHIKSSTFFPLSFSLVNRLKGRVLSARHSRTKFNFDSVSISTFDIFYPITKRNLE